MRKKDIEKFKKERDYLNDMVMKYAKTNIKRFYNLDSSVYKGGTLSKKTKELLGLVSSLVLRCDDCVEYHLITSHEENASDSEIEEALSIGLVVGGSIVIPHLRRAFEIWDELRCKDFDSLLKKIEAVVKKPSKRDEKLQFICGLLSGKVEHYDWVGFYISNNSKRELVLGPFVGEKTEHVKIKFGEGICGQAAERQKLFIVQDVSEEKNYLSCSPKVRSEIVMPILKNDKIVGELDIDSHEMNTFTSKDKDFLERICKMVVKIF